MDPFEDIFSPEPVDTTTLRSSSPSAEETMEPQIRQAQVGSCGNLTWEMDSGLGKRNTKSGACLESLATHSSTLTLGDSLCYCKRCTFFLVPCMQTSDGTGGVAQPPADAPAEGVLLEPQSVAKVVARRRLSSVGSNESNGSRRSSRSRKSSTDSGSIKSGTHPVRKRKKVSTTLYTCSYVHACTPQLLTLVDM